MELKQMVTLAERQDESVIGYNEDLLFQILIRLPSKSIIRFKCVSKYWYSLISDPRFVQFYLDQHQIATNPWAFVFVPFETSYRCKQKKLEIFSDIALRGNKKPFFRPDFRFLEEPETWGCVVGSFNDLVLCGVGAQYLCTCYYISNPFTKEYVALPPPPPFHGPVSRVRDVFICEPFYTGDNNFNLQYRFRVVLMPALPHQMVTYPDLELRIFASETGLWSEHRLPHKLRPLAFVACHSSGLVMSLCGDSSCHDILVFDPFIATENRMAVIKGHKVDMPMGLRHFYGWNIKLIASQGRVFLSQLVIGMGDPNPTVTMWELLQDREWKWRLIHNIPFGDLVIVEREIDMKIPSPFNDDKDFLAKFLKNMGSTIFGDRGLYYVVHFGFDPTDANIIFLIIVTPEMSFDTLASCNLLTKTIKLLPMCEVVPMVGRRCPMEFYFNSRNIFPLVLQPWPTPLPKLGTAAVFFRYRMKLLP